jgi:hypothetical protein
MDILTFIVEFTKAIAWPATAGAIAFGNKVQIRELVSRMRKGKLGPAEFEFEQGVKELDEKNHNEINTPTRSESNPRDKVIDEWSSVEKALRQRAVAENLPNATTKNPQQLIRQLVETEKLNPVVTEMFQELESLRNTAAHARTFQPEPEAIRIYISMTTKLKDLIHKP